MSTVTPDRSTLDRPTNGPSRLSRAWSLASAETRLLVRNRTALVNSVLLPLLFVAAVPALGLDEGEFPYGARLLVTAVGISLVMVTYYNLVTTYVARREDLVLQRMRTGELTDVEVLAGTAAPTVFVTLGQVVVIAAGVVLLGEWSAPADVVLPLVALLAGTLLMVVLAAASTSFTRTPESAQITTLPIIVVSTGLSGVFYPLSVLPEALGQIARFLPLTPVVELLQLGLAGQTWQGDAVDGSVWPHAGMPLAVLAGWLVVGSIAARRGFRWAPRR
ncbi:MULTISPECIES: ABC transporter permease [unclassified Modestobacter]|uniref:ABC transporter permease n=1 Tax=unclassified Modestobacter TaxID=2643866 RepID=UPI0022AA13FF|nr:MULTISPECIES: ABC transporter permease [unclassified Modestobacter]MCZ2811265.1 ABC transporter permease [Modestobacter sp. VKM Ac-2979]MCZ2840778.1 ABC transporter permease [Modestobacter sp. VKM Ac-2980]MCZ2848061.1 ABC transporter permease [Modestobacter sp. VKM Ac-2978]